MLRVSKSFVVALFVLLAVSLISLVSASVRINEAMPHSNNALGGEWVELYNSGSSAEVLSNWIIGDRVSNDTISLNIPSNGFAIISSGIDCSKFNVPSESCVKLSAIGSGLNDDSETVYLYNNSLVDSFTWSTSIKSSGNSWQVCNSLWGSYSPTPGTANICEVQQSQTSQDSSLTIVDFPSRATFGETINVEINAYRGDTAKDTIYIYIKKGEDMITEKASLHLDDKLRNYSFAVPVAIKVNCNSQYEEGIYDLVLEGLDKFVLKDITLKGSTKCESEESMKRGKVTYKLDFPDEFEKNKEFLVSIKIYNNQNKKGQFSAWSYVYKDAICYSCGNKTKNKEENAQQVVLDKYDSGTLFLKNVPEVEGDYKLKIKILEEGYEVTKDFTFDIFIKPSTKILVQTSTGENDANLQTSINQSSIKNESQNNTITGKVIYSSNKKSPITTLLLFVLLCVLLLFYFIAKRIKNSRPVNEENKEAESNSEEEECEEEQAEDENSENITDTENIKTETDEDNNGI